MSIEKVEDETVGLVVVAAVVVAVILVVYLIRNTPSAMAAIQQALAAMMQKLKAALSGNWGSTFSLKAQDPSVPWSPNGGDWVITGTSQGQDSNQTATEQVDNSVDSYQIPEQPYQDYVMGQ